MVLELWLECGPESVLSSEVFMQSNSLKHSSSDETDVQRREGEGGSFLVQLAGHPSKMEEARELSKTGV